MSNYAHQTALTQFVEAAGIRFAYRRFANRRYGPKINIPLLFFMHFTGTMDHWDDPSVTDGFCQFAHYLRIWGAPRKLSANRSTLFANTSKPARRC
jgi:hypothetical protein